MRSDVFGELGAGIKISGVAGRSVGRTVRRMAPFLDRSKLRQPCIPGLNSGFPEVACSEEGSHVFKWVSSRARHAESINRAALSRLKLRKGVPKETTAAWDDDLTRHSAPLPKRSAYRASR